VYEGRCCTRGLLLLHRPGSAFQETSAANPEGSSALVASHAVRFNILQLFLRQKLPNRLPLGFRFVLRSHNINRKLPIDNCTLALGGSPLVGCPSILPERSRMDRRTGNSLAKKADTAFLL
jgi:hypothetical protein